MQIENARPEDAAELVPLMDQLVDTPAEVSLVEQTLVRILADPAYHLLVAREQGHILGTMMGILCYDLTGRCEPFMVVENVVTAASARGKGVARALMAELERIARAHHCTCMMLCSGQERTGAHEAYRRMGFSDTITKGFKKML